MVLRELFDRLALRKHRDRASIQFPGHTFLFDETESRLNEKLNDINRKFHKGLSIGCHTNEIIKNSVQLQKGLEWVVTDLSPELAVRSRKKGGPPIIVMDEEFLTFKENTFDLVVSNLCLHWVNDIPGTLKQIFRILKPDGLLLATLLGEQTLTELQQSLLEAEIKIENGASPRVSPFIQISDAGDLLVRAGFALPVADLENITVYYSNAFKLMNDLRAMGETNSNHLRKKTFTRRSTLNYAANLYHDLFKNKNGKIPATFSILSLTGWVPHKDQQQPLKPGSGIIQLENAVNN